MAMIFPVPALMNGAQLTAVIEDLGFTEVEVVENGEVIEVSVAGMASSRFTFEESAAAVAGASTQDEIENALAALLAVKQQESDIANAGIIERLSPAVFAFAATPVPDALTLAERIAGIPDPSSDFEGFKAALAELLA